MRHWMCVFTLQCAALLATTHAAPTSTIPASLIDDEAEGVATSIHGSDDYSWDNSLGYFRLSRPKYSVRDLGLAPQYYVDTSRFRLRPITVVRLISKPVVSQQDNGIPLHRVFAEQVEEIQLSTPHQPGLEADASQPPVLSETPEAASGTALTSEGSVVLEAEKALDAAVSPNTPEVAAEAEKNANVSESEKASASKMPPATPERPVEADDRSEAAQASVAIDDESATTTGEVMESKTQAMEQSEDEGEREPAVEFTSQYKDVLPTREESEADHVKDTEDDGKVEFDEVENVSVLVEQAADDGDNSMTREGLVVEGTMEEKEVEGTMEEKETGDENADEDVKVMIELEEVEGTMEEKETEVANGDEDGEVMVEEKEVEGRPTMEEKEFEGTLEDKEVEGRPTLEEKEVDGLKTTGEGSDEAGVEERTESLLPATQAGDVHEQEVDARRESASRIGLSDASDERELSSAPDAGGNSESTTTTTTAELEGEDKEDSTIHVADESQQVKTSEIPIAYTCTPISISSIRSETKSEKHPKPLVHPPIWKPIKRARYRLLQALVHKPNSEPFDHDDRYSQSTGYDAHSIF